MHICTFLFLDVVSFYKHDNLYIKTLIYKPSLNQSYKRQDLHHGYNLQYKHIKNLEANANPFIKKKIYIYIFYFFYFFINGLAFASRFLMCLYCKLYTWCNYGSLITLIKRGFVNEGFYVKIVMFIRRDNIKN